MGAISLRLRYRPIRIGWCVETDQWRQLRRALRLSHAFAGGTFNPVIPVDDPGLAESLVDRFRVDLLYPVEASAPIDGFIKAHPYLPWAGVDKHQLFVKWDGQTPEACFVDVQHAVNAIFDGEADVPDGGGDGEARIYSWDESDPLADILLIAAGDYPEDTFGTPDYRGLIWIELVPVKSKVDFAFVSHGSARRPSVALSPLVGPIGAPPLVA